MYIASDKRYETMKYNRCGKSGLMLPAVSLGLWHNFGDTSSFTNMEKLCFTPLAQGVLTDRYLNGIPADSRVRTDSRFLKESSLTAEKIERVRGLNEIAKRKGQTLAEMALAWILKDGAVTSVLIGASKPAQILDNIKALENTTFTVEELAQIDALSVM
ncbi:MAG: aldo/keto reductase [Lachnospiraceae bacterium]